MGAVTKDWECVRSSRVVDVETGDKRRFIVEFVDLRDLRSGEVHERATFIESVKGGLVHGRRPMVPRDVLAEIWRDLGVAIGALDAFGAPTRGKFAKRG